MTSKVLLQYAILGVLVVAVVAAVIGNAWVADDAYITFRVVKNAVDGFGLRWNIQERVQVYTHPLWLLIHVGLFFVTREIYITTIIFSIVLTVITIVILIRFHARSFEHALFILVVLLLSRAFRDYSTSGMENSLLHLFIVIFYAIVLGSYLTRKNVAILFILAALMWLTRPDALLLVLPSLLYTMWKFGFWESLTPLMPGLLIGGVWEAFSFLYYGFLVPNPAYAKLDVDIPRIEFIQHGYQYLVDSFLYDPITLTIVVAGVIVGIMAYKKPAAVAVAASLLLYLAFVVWVGGDFMSGRFLSVPLILALVGISYTCPMERSRFGSIVPLLIFALGFRALASELPVIRQTDALRAWGIVDERNFRLKQTSATKIFPQNPDVVIGAPWKQLQAAEGVAFTHEAGVAGYYANRSLYLVDAYAVTNPVLSHLSWVDRKLNYQVEDYYWRTGHFRRRIPCGYIQSLQTGNNEFQDPEMARYYDAMRAITQDRIFSRARMQSMVQYYTGVFSQITSQEYQECSDVDVVPHVMDIAGP